MIRTRISLVDSFTGPIMHMQQAMSSMITACHKLNTASGKVIDVSADTSLVQARAYLARTEVSMEELRKSMKKTEQENERMSQKMSSGNSKLIGGVKRLAAAYLSIQSAQKVIGAADTMTSTQARLNMINDGAQTTAQLQNMIYKSANDTRASYNATAESVAKIGLNAGSAFDNVKEIVKFSELVNKNFAIGGASAEEQKAAMLQLTQAMGSGVLQGDELRSVSEQAPMILNSIAKYMNVSKGAVKELASEGKVTSDVVKKALFAAADDTNKMFREMPVTWAQVWTMGCNRMQKAFTPVLQEIGKLAGNKEVSEFVVEATDGLGKVGSIAVSTLGFVARMGHSAFSIWKEHGTTIKSVAKNILLCYAAYKTFNIASKAAVGIQKAATIISGARTIGLQAEMIALSGQAAATVGATEAQTAMNAAMLASPITWIVIAILAVIFAIHQVVQAGNEYLGWHTSTLGVIVGSFSVAGGAIWNLILAIFSFVLGIINALVNRFIIFGNFLGNVFDDPIGSIIHLFGDLGDYALSVLQTIAGALDKLFGSSLSDSVQGWRDSLSGSVDNLAQTYGNGKYKKKYNNLNLSTEGLGLERAGYKEVYNAGMNLGNDMTKKVTGMKDKFLGKKGSVDKTGDSKGIGMSDIGKGTSGGSKMTNEAKKLSKNTGDTAKNTKAIKDNLDITSEQVKYIKDYATRKAVNRFTTATIKVDMINNNKIDSKQDLDGITTTLAKQLKKEMAAVAGGAY